MRAADLKSLDNEIQHVTGSTRTDDEALRAWLRVLEERVTCPCDGAGGARWVPPKAGDPGYRDRRVHHPLRRSLPRLRRQRSALPFFGGAEHLRRFGR
jgi:hypothetical protein